MLIQLVVATIMVFVTVLIHGAGIPAMARGLRIEPGAAEQRHHFSLKQGPRYSIPSWRALEDERNCPIRFH